MFPALLHGDQLMERTMRIKPLLIAAGVLAAAPAFAQAAADPARDPKKTEVWSPVPAIVATPAGAAPSDAIVLFDGKDLSRWESEQGGRVPWTVADGAMTVVPGSKGIRTRQGFCDVQLHVEWRTPVETQGFDGQNRGNSGIFLQGLYELQVLDSYNNRTYANGQAGSIYKQALPLVNASRAPGQWQAYDIIWKARASRRAAGSSRPRVSPCCTTACWCRMTPCWRARPSTSAHRRTRPMPARRSICRSTIRRSATATSGYASCNTRRLLRQVTGDVVDLLLRQLWKRRHQSAAFPDLVLDLRALQALADIGERGERPGMPARSAPWQAVQFAL